MNQDLKAMLNIASLDHPEVLNNEVFRRMMLLSILSNPSFKIHQNGSETEAVLIADNVIEILNKDLK